jgi:mRNA interferase MazF
VITRGDIYLVDFGTPAGHEPGFRHPAIVVSADDITRTGTPIVVPITKTKRGYATHVELDGILPMTCYAQCELVRAVSVDRFIRKVGGMDPVPLLAVETILRRILNL